jgi:4-amino-4-deoxy-L-arabinose transferase-like glycosyltransferase
VIAIGYLGRRVAGARVGLVAAAIAAICPVLIGADASLLTESLFGLCVAAAMLVGYRLLDRPGAGWALALGVVIGVASLARSEGLLLLPLLAIPVVWRKGTPTRLVATRAAVACLGVALAVGPWTARNWARFDRPVIGSNNSGSVIAGANCDSVYHGSNVGLWEFDCIGSSGSANEAVAAARQRRQGVDYARDHAGRAVVVAGVRVLRTWDLFQPWSTVGINEGRDPTMSRIGLVFYWLLVPAAIAGVALLGRRHEPLRILLAPVILVTVISALGWGITRFRHAAEIPIVILAAVALSALCDRLQKQRAPTQSVQ